MEQTHRDLKPERSPAAALPLGLMAFGLCHLVALAAFLLWLGPAVAGGWLRNPAALVATHLFTLGFATPVAMGALYQMVPVLLHSRAPAPRWAGLQAILHGAGTWTLLWGFWRWRTGWIATGGTLVAAGVLLFAWLLGTALRRAERSQLQAPAMAAAAGYLALAVAWAVVLALNLRHGFLGAGTGLVGSHAALGILGWLLLLTAAVSYRLVPMFAGSRPGPAWPRRTALPVLAAAPAAIYVAALLGRGEAAGALGLVAAGAAAVYAADLLGMVRRRRPGRLEFTTGYAGAAGAALLAGALLAAGLLRAGLLGAGLLGAGLPHPAPPDRPGRLVAVAALYALGWQATMIMGQMVRIVPFIIWLDRFRRRWVRERIPFLHEMVSPRLPWPALAAWLGGTAAWAAGAWVSPGTAAAAAGAAAAAAASFLLRAGGALLLAGALLYAGAVLGAYRHLRHRPAPGQSTELDPSAHHLRDPER